MGGGRNSFIVSDSTPSDVMIFPPFTASLDSKRETRVGIERSLNSAFSMSDLFEALRMTNPFSLLHTVDLQKTRISMNSTRYDTVIWPVNIWNAVRGYIDVPYSRSVSPVINGFSDNYGS